LDSFGPVIRSRRGEKEPKNGFKKKSSLTPLLEGEGSAIPQESRTLQHFLYIFTVMLCVKVYILATEFTTP
jgi:hypothetical protein